MDSFKGGAFEFSFTVMTKSPPILFSPTNAAIFSSLRIMQLANSRDATKFSVIDIGDILFGVKMYVKPMLSALRG